MTINKVTLIITDDLQQIETEIITVMEEKIIIEETIILLTRNRTRQKLPGTVHTIYMDVHIRLATIKPSKHRKKTSRVRKNMVVPIISIIKIMVVDFNIEMTKTIDKKITILKKMKKVTIIPKKTKIPKILMTKKS